MKHLVVKNYIQHAVNICQEHIVQEISTFRMSYKLKVYKKAQKNIISDRIYRELNSKFYQKTQHEEIHYWLSINYDTRRMSK